MDVVAVYYGSCHQWNLDVTVHGPFAVSIGDAANCPGLAARSGERTKHSRYGWNVCPISFEKFGRLGDESLEVLRMLLSEASLHGAVAYDAAPCIVDWRRRLELTLVYEVADSALVSLGHSCLGLQWQHVQRPG